MRFPWFRKKAEVAVLPNPAWSVNNFVVVTSPLAQSPKTDRSREEIDSYLAALVGENPSEGELALAEFLQERDIQKYELTQFSKTGEGARSAKITQSGARVLLGSPQLIARASMPFHDEITRAIEAGANQVFAIDAIAYAAFTLTYQ